MPASTKQAIPIGMSITGSRRTAVNRSINCPLTSEKVTVIADITAKEAANAWLFQPRNSIR